MPVRLHPSFEYHEAADGTPLPRGPWREGETPTAIIATTAFLHLVIPSISTAVFEGFFETHSPAWHAKRHTGLGGSDIAAVTGCSKWTSRYQLWAERTGNVDREDDGKNGSEKRWGAKLEAVIIDQFAEDHPELLVITWPTGVGAAFRHQDRPYQLANPDAIYYVWATGEWGILEAKTARYDDEWHDPTTWDHMVPRYYATQDQWYLDGFGWKLSHFAVLFTGSDYREYPVLASTWEQDVNRQQALEFLDLVEKNVPPRFDGHEQTLITVRRMHPDIEKGLIAQLDDVGERLVMAANAYKTAESNLNEAKATAIAKMGKAQYGHVGDAKVCARQARGQGTPFIVMKGESK